jgi:hypothetical protein
MTDNPVVKHGRYSPLYEKQDTGDVFIICVADQTSDDEQKAWEIGWATSFVEGIVFCFRFTGQAVNTDEPLMHFTGKLAGMPIAVVSGAIFDDAISKVDFNEVGFSKELPHAS